jgi:glycosyltransferase involved in cell wall biosynthesis/ubiquinone/menaquinone biosynthesis C-methylase UbiE
MPDASVRPKVLVIGPVPPPAFGVAKATKLMVESPTLAEHVQIIHMDTSDVRGFTNMGKLDVHNLALGLSHLGQLVRLLRRERPQVALLTASQGKFALVRDWLLAYLCRHFGACTTTYLRGSGYAQIRANQGLIAFHLLRSMLKHSACVFVLGESLVSMAQAVYPKTPVAVIPNGCPPAVRPDQVSVRRRGTPVLVYIGRISYEKGVEEALLAARSIVAAVPALEFIICGEWDSPAFEARVRSLAESYGLANNVRFPGPLSVDERADVLADAWVLLAPSHSEGQPWVILEAMSAGVPVVATDTGAVAETVGDGQTGFVVPIGDDERLAAYVTTLLKDDDLWSQFSRQAVRRYQEHFTVERSHGVLAQALTQVALLTEAYYGCGEKCEQPRDRADSAAEWFSANAEGFDRQYGVSALFSERHELWSRLIRESCSPGRRVLDAGCGSGVFAVIAAEHAGEVVAADMSRQMLEVCAQRCSSQRLCPCTFLHSKIEELKPVELGQFDLILASSVLEYVNSLPDCLDSLSKLSRSGATLIASFPNTQSSLRMAEKVSYRLFARPKYLGWARNAPSASEVKSLMDEAGFVIREVHYYGVPRVLRPAAKSSFVRSRVGTMVAFVATRN